MIYKLIKHWRSQVLVWLTHSLALPILKLVRKPERFPYTKEQLINFPEGTMGKALVNFLDTKDLELLTYYARHDLKHILLEYDTTDEGEGCLQCFMLGNGHLSFPVLATVIYCFVTMPEYWSKFRSAYQRGSHTPSLEKITWFDLLPQPVTTARKILTKKTIPDMKRFLGSLSYAGAGLRHCFLKEKNFLVHVIAAAFALVSAVVFRVSQTELMILLLNIGLVMSFEMVNSCVERICNFVHPQHNSLIKIIKDVAAGAVLLVALIAATCGCIIFLPKILSL